MIVNESAMDKLALVSRMLAYQQDQGVSVDAALKTLRATLSEQYMRSIDALEKMISGEQDVVLTGYGDGPYAVFTRLANIIRSEGGQVSDLFVSSQELVNEAVIQAREYWSGYNALIAYMGFVSLFAVICIGIYSIFVLPEFSVLFDSFGAELPLLTKWVVEQGYFFTVILILMVLIVLVGLFSSYHIKKRVMQFLPLYQWTLYVPGFGRLSRTYCYYLFIQYVYILQKSGLNYEKSLAHAKNISLMNSNRAAVIFADWLEAIDVAAKMGALDQEVEFQIQQTNSLFSRQMIIARERMSLMMQITLGVVVGLLVIAMYLPIFQLGSVV